LPAARATAMPSRVRALIKSASIMWTDANAQVPRMESRRLQGASAEA